VIETYLAQRGVPARAGASLAPMTTFGLGGTARVVALPERIEQVVDAIHGAQMEGLPVRILGGGSNLVVSDAPFDGVVVRMRRLRARRFFADGVEAEAGVSFPLLVKETVERGLGGIETLCGIPGTMGGILAMNAGGRHGEIKDVVEWVDVLESDGSVRRLGRGEIVFGYRFSSLREKVVLGCRLRLAPGDPSVLARRRREIQEAKEASQPLHERTAGCMFRNPAGGSAGRLIEEAGLKNARRGGARISPVHANFIVNEGNATAHDVLSLAEAARDEVRGRFGVTLEYEVVVW
jgi:UDP-N-acetylmuramate dehydrogenase